MQNKIGAPLVIEGFPIIYHVLNWRHHGLRHLNITNKTNKVDRSMFFFPCEVARLAIIQKKT